MLVGTLGRGPAVNLHLTDRDVGVGHHHVERIGNLAQLAAVVHVVGLHLPAVDDESDVSRAVQVALLLLGGGHDVGQTDEVVGIGGQQLGHKGLLVLQLVAAAAEVALHIDIGGAEPRLVLDGVAVAIGLRLTVLTAYIVAVGGIALVDAVALEDDVLSASADDERLQALIVLAILTLDDRRKGAVAV